MIDQQREIIGPKIWEVFNKRDSISLSKQYLKLVKLEELVRLEKIDPLKEIRFSGAKNNDGCRVEIRTIQFFKSQSYFKNDAQNINRLILVFDINEGVNIIDQYFEVTTSNDSIITFYDGEFKLDEMLDMKKIAKLKKSKPSRIAKKEREAKIKAEEISREEKKELSKRVEALIGHLQNKINRYENGSFGLDHEENRDNMYFMDEVVRAQLNNYDQFTTEWLLFVSVFFMI
jgi:hypothetical protein